MRCNDWNNDWVAHLYDELDDRERQRLEHHLAGCPGCRQEMDRLSATRRLLQDSSPVVPSAPRVMLLRPRLRLQPLWAFAAGLATAAVVFWVGLLAGPRLTGVATPATAEPVTWDRIENALRAQEASFERRLQEARQTGVSEPRHDTMTAHLTRQALDEELELVRRQFQVQRSRDLEFVLEEIAATEARAGSWVGETREALLAVALTSDPRFSEQ